MARWGLRLTAIIVVLGLVGGGLLYANAMKGVSVTITMKGKHSSPGGYGAAGGYPFDLSGTVDADAEKLGKGGNEALKALFGSLKDKRNGNAPVTGVEGDLKIEGGKVSGNVKVTWNYQGNPLWISGDIEGTISVAGGKCTGIDITGKNTKAGGSWNWGGGAAQLGGSGSFSAKGGSSGGGGDSDTGK